jgi:hypothetical protein
MASMSSPRSRSTPRRHRPCVRSSKKRSRMLSHYACQNRFASFGPARNLKDNNVSISGGAMFSNTRIDREFDTNTIMK